MSLKVILFLTWADPLNLSWSFRSQKVQIIRKTFPLPSLVSIASDLLTSEMMIYIHFIVCGLFTCFLSLFPRKRNIPQERMEFVLTTTACIPVQNTRLVHSRVQYLCVTWISVLKNICVGKKNVFVDGRSVGFILRMIVWLMLKFMPVSISPRINEDSMDLILKFSKG